MLAEMMMNNAVHAAKVQRDLSQFEAALAPLVVDYRTGMFGFSISVPTGTQYLGCFESGPTTFTQISVSFPPDKDNYEIALRGPDGHLIPLDECDSIRNLSDDPEYVISTIKHLMAIGYLDSDDVPDDDDVSGGAAP
mgnify:CR=1 FL=1|tara:strand:- start:262 stop:672 length:411 start_codon:yes stop_codon:yes gene_type:complete